MAITKVEYYSNGQLIGTRTEEPFDQLDYTFTGIGTTQEIIAKLYVDGKEVSSTQPRILNVIEEPTLDPDYLAVLDYASANSIPLPDSTQQSIDSQLLIDYKTTGAWDRDDVVAKFTGTADPAFKLIDWKRLIQMTPVGGLTWSVNGVKGDGTTGYINSGFIPYQHGVNYTLDNAGVMYYDKVGDFNHANTTTHQFFFGAYSPVSGSLNAVYTYFGGGRVQSNGVYYNYKAMHGKGNTGSGQVYNPKVGVNALYLDGGTTINAHTGYGQQTSTEGTKTNSVPRHSIYLLGNNSNGTASLFTKATMGFATIGGSKNDIHSSIETVLNTL